MFPQGEKCQDSTQSVDKDGRAQAPDEHHVPDLAFVDDAVAGVLHCHDRLLRVAAYPVTRRTKDISLENIV